MYQPGLLRSRLAPVRRWVWGVVQPVVVVMLAFGGAVLIGQLPVNRGFREAESGVEVFVYVDSAHAEIVVPLRSEVHDWTPWFSASDFAGLTGQETYASFSWGDREFFLNTPRWEDVRASLTSWAMLWPTETVMHVTLKRKPAADNFYHSVTIDSPAYQRMVEFIESHFVLDGSNSLSGCRPRLIPGRGFGPRDAFYQATGTYSIQYTCNAWVSDALQVAGVRTGCWTPFPVGILQLKE